MAEKPPIEVRFVITCAQERAGRRCGDPTDPGHEWVNLHIGERQVDLDDLPPIWLEVSVGLSRRVGLSPPNSSRPSAS